MTDMTPEQTPGPDGTEGLGGQETTGNSGHPAWQPILDALPDDALRSMVTPHLQEWDNGVQQRFQQLHEQYEPWKPVIESANPEVVQQALGLINQIEQDPQYVVNALIEAYGLDLSQGQQQPQPQVDQQPQTVSFDGQEYDANDPLIQRLTAMEEVLGGLEQFIQSDVSQREEAQAIAAYEAHMTALQQKHPGPYDETVIDAMVANGVDPEQALINYQTAVKQAALGIGAQPQQPTAPVVMGGTAGGSGLPSQQTSPADLNPQDTRALVAEMARRAFQSE